MLTTPVVINLLTDPKERESWPVLQAYNWVYAHVRRLRDGVRRERPARAADPGRRADRPRAGARSRLRLRRAPGYAAFETSCATRPSRSMLAASASVRSIE